jgi:hypothetical protein
MRCAYNDACFVTEKDEVVGFSFAADYCAEHECGVKRTKAMFRCDGKKKGLYSCKIRKDVSVSGTVEIDGVSWEYIATKPIGVEHYAVKWPSIKDKDAECNVKSGWCDGDFAVLCDVPGKLGFLKQAFSRKDVLISVGGGHVFKNGGLYLLVASKTPKEIYLATVKKDEEYISTKKALEKSKAFKLLEKKADEWREKYPASHDTPFSYIALCPHGTAYWLNPAHQQHLHWGYVTIQDIDDWANERVGTVIRDLDVWEDLKLKCRLPFVTYGIDRSATAKKGFTFIPFEEYKNWPKKDRSPLKVTRKKDDYGYYKLEEKSWRFLLGYLKYRIMDDMCCQLDIYSFLEINKEDFARKLWAYVESKPKTGLCPRNDLDSEIYGMLLTLSMQGVGDFHSMCGTNREDGPSPANMAEIKEILRHECYYEILDRCGILPDAWRVKLPEESK